MQMKKKLKMKSPPVKEKKTWLWYFLERYVKEKNNFVSNLNLLDWVILLISLYA